MRPGRSGGVVERIEDRDRLRPVAALLELVGGPVVDVERDDVRAAKRLDEPRVVLPLLQGFAGRAPAGEELDERHEALRLGALRMQLHE